MSELTTNNLTPDQPAKLRTLQPVKSLTRRGLKKRLSEEKIRATHDPLTGILNRAGFQEMFTRETARINRSKIEAQIHQHEPRRDDKAIIIYLDLNEFKQINEKLGHAGGDKQLIKATQTLINSCRPSDIVARMGGDEFAMVLPGNDISSARDYWSNTLLPALNSNGISVSAGICEVDSEYPEASLALADELQSMAKDNSRNLGNSTQVVFAEV